MIWHKSFYIPAICKPVPECFPERSHKAMSIPESVWSAWSRSEEFSCTARDMMNIIRPVYRHAFYRLLQWFTGAVGHRAYIAGNTGKRRSLHSPHPCFLRRRSLPAKHPASVADIQYVRHAQIKKINRINFHYFRLNLKCNRKAAINGYHLAGNVRSILPARNKATPAISSGSAALAMAGACDYIIIPEPGAVQFIFSVND